MPQSWFWVRPKFVWSFVWLFLIKNLVLSRHFWFFGFTTLHRLLSLERSSDFGDATFLSSYLLTPRSKLLSTSAFQLRVPFIPRVSLFPLPFSLLLPRSSFFLLQLFSFECLLFLEIRSFLFFDIQFVLLLPFLWSFLGPPSFPVRRFFVLKLQAFLFQFLTLFFQRCLLVFPAFACLRFLIFPLYALLFPLQTLFFQRCLVVFPISACLLSPRHVCRSHVTKFFYG